LAECIGFLFFFLFVYPGIVFNFPDLGFDFAGQFFVQLF